MGIEFQTVGIAAAFREHFELLRHRMIAPNRLTQKFHALNVRRAGAAVGAVKPAIRPPCEAIRATVRILETKAAQRNFRWAVRYIVAIFVWVEEQIRRVQDPHTASAADDTARDVQGGKKIFCLVEYTIPSRALENFDAVCSL